MNSRTYAFAVGLLTLASCRQSGLEHDASGSFEAVETIISAQVPGQILVFDVEEGMQLAAGQVVGQIDSTQLYAQKLQLLQSRRAILSGRPQTAVQVEALRKELANAVLDRDRTVAHMRENGFTVRTNDLADLTDIKTSRGVPDQVQSCHTAVVSGYVVEGHVPAADVHRLLKEKPAIAGIAVRSPTSSSHRAPGGGSKDALGSVMVTVSPTQSRIAHSVTSPTSCTTTSMVSSPSTHERTV